MNRLPLRSHALLAALFPLLTMAQTDTTSAPAPAHEHRIALGVNSKSGA